MINGFFYKEKGTIIAFFTGCILFGIYAFINSMAMDKILYYFLIYGIVVFIYIFISFLKYYGKVKDLERLKNNISIFEPDNKFEFRGYIEEQYAEIIHELYMEINKAIKEKEDGYNEDVTYFTLWVHQIKTPISAMKLLLENGADNYSSKLDSELFKIEQYVAMAINYLKTENLKDDLIIDHCNLGDMVRQSIRKYSILCIDKGLSVNVENLDYDVMTDEKWSTFVIEQIFSNAVKYTPKGSINVYAQKTEKNIILTIEDCGIGIKKEDVERVFERGYTGLNGRRDKNATGIGLYLCKKICGIMNHDIEIESQAGAGTKVNLKFHLTEKL